MAAPDHELDPNRRRLLDEAISYARGSTSALCVTIDHNTRETEAGLRDMIGRQSIAICELREQQRTVRLMVEGYRTGAESVGDGMDDIRTVHNVCTFVLDVMDGKYQ